MWLLIEVGGLIGALPTIACVLLTALIGATLLRRGDIQMQAGGFSASGGPRGNSSGAEGRRESGHITIEGEYRKED
jgi:UPF0716 family protein affecting phage T7 exclusion